MISAEDSDHIESLIAPEDVSPWWILERHNLGL